MCVVLAGLRNITAGSTDLVVASSCLSTICIVCTTLNSEYPVSKQYAAYPHGVATVTGPSSTDRASSGDLGFTRRASNRRAFSG